MGLLKSIIRTSVAMKAFDIVRREVSRPANQRKAKEIFATLRAKAGQSPRRGTGS